MSKIRRSLSLILPLVAIATSLQAQAEHLSNMQFERYSLENGLDVILVPDNSVPVVAVDVWYHVGARNEAAGRTGFAHLFEHMMFQGSDNVGKGEHMQLIERAGGSMNGSTSADRTNYFQTLPSNRLNLGLWLEADRMRSLAVTEENLHNQTEVVKEERRLRVDNAPYGRAINAALGEVAYNPATCFAYSHELIGSMEDLEAATVDDVQAFFDTYYAPNNAVLVVVGDVDIDETKSMIEEYFGGIPSGGAVPPVTCEDAFSHLPAHRQFQDTNATLPGVFITYGLPAAGDPDVAPLELVASVLAGGESSRLHERLVRQEQVALQVFSFPDFRKGPGVFVIGAIANQGVSPERIVALVEEEMTKVREQGITAEELEKAKNQYRAQTVRGLQTVLGRAEAVHQAVFLHDDPGALARDLQAAMAVTADQIAAAANQYLIPDNRAVVEAVPASAAQE